jgi:hypothetical protein
VLQIDLKVKIAVNTISNSFSPLQVIQNLRVLHPQHGPSYIRSVANYTMSKLFGASYEPEDTQGSVTDIMFDTSNKNVFCVDPSRMYVIQLEDSNATPTTE